MRRRFGPPTAACLGWLLACLAAAPGQAQRPGCILLSLPEHLPARKAWESLLTQETRTWLDPDESSCALLEVLEADHGEAPELTLRVAWSKATRTVPLALAELPAEQRPRAGALLARGLLQQLVQESETLAAHTQTQAPPVAAAQAVATETAGAAEAPASAKAPPRSNAAEGVPRSDTSEATASLPPTPAAPASNPAPAPAIRVKDTPANARVNAEVAGQPQWTVRKSSLWSGSVLAGSTLVLESVMPLVHVELAVQRLFPRQAMRLSLALIGLMFPALDGVRNPTIGGPGLRGALDFKLGKAGRSLFLLGPGASVAELVLSPVAAQSVSFGELQSGGGGKIYRTVASVDARFSLVFDLPKEAHLVLAAELAYAVRYLRVRAFDTTLVSYAGLMLGLRLGAGF